MRAGVERAWPNLRPVSDGGVLSQCGAEGGDLLGHLFELGIPQVRLCRVEHGVECLESVQGEDLDKVVHMVSFMVGQFIVTTDSHLRLVGRECDVDLLQCLDPLGSQRVADFLESVIRAS